MKDRYASKARKAFIIFNYIFCITVALLCITPMIHILSLSLSSTQAVNSRQVGFFPVEFTIAPYQYVMKNSQFFYSFFTSVKRVILGVAVNLTLIVLAAYPLSKKKSKFAARQFYVWFYLIVMLFNAGLIPTYLVVSKTGIIDTLWALVLPNAVPVFYLILMQNFMKALPEEISESAFIDGAGHWATLQKIILPLCKPSFAAILLFVIVMHWNDWFSGIIYMNNPKNYPLQSYLRTLIIDVEAELSMSVEELANKTAQSSNSAAQMFLAMLPVLIVYPFLQKYFTKGIVLGAVKG